jgi:hypothetical protein
VSARSVRTPTHVAPVESGHALNPWRLAGDRDGARRRISSGGATPRSAQPESLPHSRLPTPATGLPPLQLSRADGCCWRVTGCRPRWSVAGSGRCSRRGPGRRRPAAAAAPAASGSRPWCHRPGGRARRGRPLGGWRRGRRQAARRSAPAGRRSAGSGWGRGASQAGMPGSLDEQVFEQQREEPGEHHGSDLDDG